jgi:hypothetical protein
VATPEARPREFLPNARELALLFAARGIACVLAWKNGFRALSDDDYARISIAQRFAHAPQLDPSGTSWLPAPFWAYGAAFRCFGTGLGVARATAIAAGLAATVLVYVAARVLGAGRLGALLGAALSSLVTPYSAYLGIAAVPELPCAALLLFGAATLSRRDLTLRNLGALALLAACWSRYEAWPIAAIFAGLCVLDAYRRRQLAFLGCAALALSGPLVWLAWGRVEHGHALFFVTRVTSYRRALGGSDASLWRRVFEYPVLLFEGAAELSGLLLVVAMLTRKSTHEQLSYRRCTLALLGMLAFLILGSVRDGVPTHHAGRVLLPIWLFASVITASRAAVLVTEMSGPVRAAVGLAILGWTWLMTPLALPRHALAERSTELEAGTAARGFTDRSLAIDTADYGYFAVQASFGSPANTTVLDEHDPRHPLPSPFSSAQALDQALRDRHAGFVIVTKTHASLLDPRCTKLWDNASFALFQCAPISG